MTSQPPAAHSSNPAGPTLRLAVERLLSTADLRPEGLSPAAVLVVRRMGDPLPGGLAAGLDAPRVSGGWERQARARLSGLLRGAARPVRGPVGANAEAVLFADESELLACLALDVGRGLALERWWWRAVLRSTLGRGLPGSAEAGEALVRHLERQAHFAPAALALLDDLGEAVRALLALSPAQAQRVLAAVLAAFQLPAVSAQSSPALAAAGQAFHAARPPWKPLPSALGAEREILLGWSLDLVRRPQEARSPAYRRKALAWLRSPGAEAGQPAGPVRQPAESAALPEDGTPAAAERAAGRVAPAAEESGPALASLRKEAAPGEIASRPGQSSPALPAPGSAPGAGQAAARSPGQPDAPAQASAPQPPAQGNQPAPTSAPVTAAQLVAPKLASPWAADGLSTRLGGCLYLINLLVFLELPESFEDRGWRLASRVGPWGLLEAITRELLGSGPGRGDEDDPLWLALAALDDRPPGLPPGYRLPRSRPKRWPPFEPPEGWFKEPQPALPPLRRLAGPTQIRGETGPADYPPLLGRWLRLAMPYIERRLRLAMQLEEGVELADALLRLPARLYISGANIDMVVSLENVSLPARRAGLDRDPGWLPQLGKVIHFYFE